MHFATFTSGVELSSHTALPLHEPLRLNGELRFDQGSRDEH
ncbi:hypothetical protein USDA257_p02620 (plasmid) [Sinorhizobium fredii USDA 257]|uniref:Uncharacterized protein n=1 Tax=Sinorhizobium fredii (strain USDA 257) TaxID=1185652 RepID=I3XGH1_SINF2|nr:hypothetical protein USDA257_p02620 [Sinorhizobium fredii USDA 257]